MLLLIHIPPALPSPSSFLILFHLHSFFICSTSSLPGSYILLSSSPPHCQAPTFYSRHLLLIARLLYSTFVISSSLPHYSAPLHRLIPKIRVRRCDRHILRTRRNRHIRYGAVRTVGGVGLMIVTHAAAELHYSNMFCTDNASCLVDQERLLDFPFILPVSIYTSSFSLSYLVLSCLVFSFLLNLMLSPVFRYTILSMLLSNLLISFHIYSPHFP